MKIIKIKPEYLIITIVIIIILHNFKSPKNAYLIFKNDYKTRIINSYNNNYCKDESIGFLSHVKQKYKIQKSIEIKNFFISPDPSWFFFNSNATETVSDKMILLGFTENKAIKFRKRDNYFVSRAIKKLNNIKKISFNSESNQELKFLIYQEFYGEKTKIYEANLKKIFIGANTINLNHSFQFAQSNAKIVILFETDSKEQNFGLSNVKLYQTNDINLVDHTIYEKSGNCYLISKND